VRKKRKEGVPRDRRSENNGCAVQHMWRKRRTRAKLGGNQTLERKSRRTRRGLPVKKTGDYRERNKKKEEEKNLEPVFVTGRENKAGPSVPRMNMRAKKRVGSGASASLRCRRASVEPITLRPHLPVGPGYLKESAGGGRGQIS